MCVEICHVKAAWFDFAGGPVFTSFVFQCSVGPAAVLAGAGTSTLRWRCT